MIIERKSIEDWIRITRECGGILDIPISLKTTSGSMEPFIRTGADTVKVTPCTPGDISRGDIVLVRSDKSGAGVLLHRVYSVSADRIGTIGDNMIAPDEWTGASELLGRAVYVFGPGKSIDLSCRHRRIQGRIIAATHGIRSVLVPVRRIIRKLFSRSHDD